MDQTPVFEMMDGDVRAWIEQEVIHLVAFDRPHRDPVELTGAMARQLAAVLLKMAEQVRE